MLEVISAPWSLDSQLLHLEVHLFLLESLETKHLLLRCLVVEMIVTPHASMGSSESWLTVLHHQILVIVVRHFQHRLVLKEVIVVSSVGLSDLKARIVRESIYSSWVASVIDPGAAAVSAPSLRMLCKIKPILMGTISSCGAYRLVPLKVWSWYWLPVSGTPIAGVVAHF